MNRHPVPITVRKVKKPEKSSS